MLSVSCPSSSEETNRGPNLRTPRFAEKSESLRFIFATQESEVGKVTREKRGRLEMIHFFVFGRYGGGGGGVFCAVRGCGSVVSSDGLKPRGPGFDSCNLQTLKMGICTDKFFLVSGGSEKQLEGKI